MSKNIEVQIDEILTRGVGEFIDPDNKLRKKLLANAKAKENGEEMQELIVKFGVDPTRPDIHLGHMVCFRKLRQLQDFGCKIIFLIGDFTAQIGDPTGKSKIRPEIEQETIRKNVNSFLSPINNGKVLLTDEKYFEWMPNGDWYYGVTDILLTDKQAEVEIGENALASVDSFVGKAQLFENTRRQARLKKKRVYGVTVNTLFRVLRNISFAQLIERDMFQNRINSRKPLFLHEMLYPILQGLDSSLIARIYGQCNLEIGGTDQTFNMLMGRTIMENEYRNMMNVSEVEEAKTHELQQSVLTFKLLEGTDGKEKMSKSLDNYISITEESNSMFGKIMSLPDTSIINYFELCTEVSMENLSKIAESIVSGTLNPRDAKLRLAKEIITIYHGAVAADEAERYFIDTFSKREIPTDVREISVRLDEKYIDVLAKNDLAESKSDARRKIDQGGVALEGEKLFIDALVSEGDDTKVLKVGKKDFVRIKIA